jgi:hypothetical protein
MDAERVSQDHEDLAIGHEDIADGLEEHAEQQFGEHTPEAAVPGIDHQAVDSAVEHGGAQTEEANAVNAIDPKISQARTKMRDRSEKRRLAVRIKNRAGGKAWTAADLAEILKKQGAQGVLVALNGRQPASGIAELKAANQWNPLLAALPKGKLNTNASRALDLMVEDSVFNQADTTHLFEIRFGHPARGNSPGAPTNAANWPLDVLQVVWRQLQRLPAQDVTQSTVINVYQSTTDAGGGSWASGTGTIELGTASNDYEYMEGTVRHEIGHAVHSQIESQVDPWLKNDIGFHTESFDAWIHDLGGYPTHFTAPGGQNVVVDQPWKDYLRGLVESYTNTGQWGPAAATPDATAPAVGQAAWAAMPQKVKNACAQSNNSWYNNFQNFQANGGSRYFLNHWYHQAFKLSEHAVNVIKATNDTYSAMSDKEFFANCYAEFFRDPTGVQNHANWGGNLPASVKAFFREVIIARHPYTKFKAAHAKKP